MASVLNKRQKEQFDRTGYYLYKGFFDHEEIQIIQNAYNLDPTLKKKFFKKKDFYGKISKIAVWNQADDSVFGMIARSYKMVDTIEHILDESVYHYHSKITMKDPFEGGEWEWHQDYGYWYNYGCLFPNMVSAMIAIDPCTKKNGCLQILSGSNKIGRIDHNIENNGKVGVDPDKVNEALKRLELVHCEMIPGDVLFFHCNTLHKSNKNDSNQRRSTLLCCYNSISNKPFKTHHHSNYQLIKKVENEKIKTNGLKFLNAELVDFVDNDGV